MPREIKTEKELLGLLKRIPFRDDKHRNEIVCGIIGHSNIQTMCFGYVYCARCGTQVGDRLASIYNNQRQVIVGHNCDICLANYKNLSWKDKIFSLNPFPFKQGEK